MDVDSSHYHDDLGHEELTWQQHHSRKRCSSTTNSASRDFCIKRPKEVLCESYRTTIQDDIHDLPHVEQSMEIEPLPDSLPSTPNTGNSVPLHHQEQQSTSHHDSISRQIVHQFSIGSGSLLLDDQHLLDSTTTEEVLHAPLQVQQEWLEMVVYARQRAKAWDSTQYTRERNALKSWLR